MNVPTLREPDVYVDTCLGRVCETIGIADEGRGAALPAVDVHVEWDEPPGTLRMVAPHAYGGRGAACFVAPCPTRAAFVPTPLDTFRVPRPAPSRGLHPATVVCALVSIVAVAAAYLWSPVGEASRERASRALSTLATR